MVNTLFAAAIGSVLLAAVIAALILLSTRASAHRQVAEAREEAEAVLADARARAESSAQEILLEARERSERTVADAEQEAERRLADVREAETRAEAAESSAGAAREEAEAAREEARAATDEAARAARAARAAEEEARGYLQQQARRLEEIAGLTAEEAKRRLLDQVESDTRQEATRMVKKAQSRARDEARAAARRLIFSALHRVAGREVLDPVVTMVRLPGDEMKGRVIGREGRNIRTLEMATGVDVIIDNTPGVILLSAYDPMRREIARVALERLIEDGRIHPARIEEVVERTREEMDGLVEQAGEAVAFEMGLTDLHERLVRLLGRLKFRTQRGYNLLTKSTEVALLAGYMAAESGAQEAVARRAGLLHAISCAEESPRSGPAATASAEIAGKFGEAPEVVEAIAAQAPGVEGRTAEAVLVQISRRISEARPGARKDNLASYIERMKKLEEIATSKDGVRRAYAIKGGKELRVLVETTELSDEQSILLSRSLARRIEAETSHPGEIRVSVIRETRSIDYAV